MKGLWRAPGQIAELVEEARFAVAFVRFRSFSFVFGRLSDSNTPLFGRLKLWPEFPGFPLVSPSLVLSIQACCFLSVLLVRSACAVCRYTCLDAFSML